METCQLDCITLSAARDELHGPVLRSIRSSMKSNYMLYTLRMVSLYSSSFWWWHPDLEYHMVYTTSGGFLGRPLIPKQPLTDNHSLYLGATVSLMDPGPRKGTHWRAHRYAMQGKRRESFGVMA